MKILITALAFILTLTTGAFAVTSETSQQVNLSVTEKGFEPSRVQVEPGRETLLTITRKTKDTCATSVLIPKLKIKRDLPLNEAVTLKIAKLEKGEIKFTCGMKMAAGVIVVK